jgi:HD superfamily phosphohydrolase
VPQVPVSSDQSTEDANLLKIVQESATRFVSIRPLSHSTVFLTARAFDRTTEKDVLLTIARVNDEDARRQLAVLRKMMTEIADERIGTVVERLWQRGSDKGWACLVSTLHPRLWPLQEAIVSEAMDAPQVEILPLIRRLCVQLHTMHSAGYAHGDISAGNVAVDERGIVHLIDFEHIVSAENLDRTRAGATPGYTHPDKISRIGQGAVAVDDHISWDMFGLGRTILAILDAALPHRFPELTPRAQRAIRLIGCLLLGGRDDGSSDVALGLPPSFLAEQRFLRVADAIAAIDRVTGRARLDVAIPELDRSYENVTRVSTQSTAPFTARVRSILNSREMQRINEFHQLGLISFIWPTATHKRYEHAIGTFGMTCGVVRSLLVDPQNPLFTVLVTPKLIRTVLVAALLHDVGHFPLAHDLEEAYFSAFDHEERSIRLITSGDLANTIRSTGADGWDADPHDVASVIAGHPVTEASIPPGICGLLHSIISGPIDSDKLDYLRRDSERLFVRAGQGMDIDRVVSSLTVALVPGKGGEHVLRMAIRSKGRRPAELVGRVRSHMFGVAYWHHSYRAIKAMIHWMVWSCIESAGRTGSKVDHVVGKLAKQFFKDLDASHEIFQASAQLLATPEPPSRRGAVPVAEAFVLDWLADRGGPDAIEMVSLLQSQRWYKSVLTIDHFANESEYGDDQEDVRVIERIWLSLQTIFKSPERERWKLRMKLARGTQARLAAWLSGRMQGNAGTIVFDFQRQRDRLIAAAGSRTLFLIDVPDPTRAFQPPLYYTRIERRSSLGVDPAQAIAAIRSYDGTRLSDEFVIANGHVRLLCHPDFDEFVERSIARGTLLRLVADGLDQVSA